MTPGPQPGRRRDRFLAQHRAALLRLSAYPPQGPAGVLTREQGGAFRARTWRVDLLGAWYTDAAAELHRPGRRPGMPALPTHDAGHRPQLEGPTASRGAS
ncbi:hypothetical protein ND748_01285 [Frankia sp. AiPs1]|uniref:hypothetical protein n=1 Tax=Frankia sp. AiPs1 TaxID=573493 RepID=UPI002044573A|nr:hypothetical protein [Frankia sp. AiPs1]MCM3920323.1 hypothetical protein [Frankia sp. AiPs1]